MPAYVVAAHTVTDPGRFEEYKSKIGPMVGKYGGRYLARGKKLRMLEGGDWTPERVVIIEFPDMASLDAWYSSPEYQPLMALRKSCTGDRDMTLAMEGL